MLDEVTRKEKIELEDRLFAIRNHLRKFILILCLIIFGSNMSFGSDVDYRQIYMDLPVPTFAYIHGIDPGQYYDYKNRAYTPYPLFRLVSPLYFKTIAIPPGYYELTPVSYKGEPYILFKEYGVVKYTIPVYKKEFVPVGFYDTHLPKPKLKWTTRVSKNLYAFLGKHFKSAQRKPTPQCYLETNDLDNKFVSLIIYYGPYRYYTILRTVQM